MPQERCVKKVPAHGRLWLPGEVRDIREFAEDGSPIVTPHFRLVGDDEKIDPEAVYDGEELKEKLVELNERDRETAVQRSLDKLDPENERHWTKTGLPSLQFICVDTGLDLTRADVHAIAPDFDRESARAFKKNEQDTKDRRAE